MNKKLIAALVCLSIIGINAIPAMGYQPICDDVSANKRTLEDPENVSLNVTLTTGFSKGISFVIGNTGDENATNVSYNVIVTKRGLLKKEIASASGINLSVDHGESIENVVSLFGIGRIQVYVNVTYADKDPVEITVNGFILFRFVFLFKSE